VTCDVGDSRPDSRQANPFSWALAPLSTPTSHASSPHASTPPPTAHRTPCLAVSPALGYFFSSAATSAATAIAHPPACDIAVQVSTTPITNSCLSPPAPAPAPCPSSSIPWSSASSVSICTLRRLPRTQRLTRPGPFQHEVSQTLRLKNPHSDPIAFKVRTSPRLALPLDCN
jgi:hypothetical protein